MTATYDAIVIGGGAIGAACARELAQTGRTVLVLERGGALGQAWQAAGGMLAAQIEAHRSDALFRLGVAGREHYRPLAAALRDSTGIDIGLWQEGIAHVARSESAAAELRSKVAWQRQAGQRCEWIEPDAVATRWPWLAPTRGALWAPEDGALDPSALVHALLADARRRGAAVVEDTVLSIERQGDHVASVVGQRGRYVGSDVVVAAGAWSALIEGLLHPVAVEPVRGQMMALAWPAGVPRAIVYGTDCYLLARGAEAIVGSTMEYVGFQPETTSSGLAGMLAAANALCPVLGTDVTRAWAGLRPVTPDGLPIIGPDSATRGLWYATGHGRNGILLAGLTGLLIKQLLDKESPHEDLTPFTPARFVFGGGAQRGVGVSP